MKVLHIGKFYPPVRGGIETYLEMLCQEIKSFIDLDVVVSNTDKNSSDEVIDGVRVRRLPTWFRFASAPIGPGLIKVIRQSDADIVHLHFPHPTATLAWLLSGHKGKLVVTYHSDIVRQRFLGAVFSVFMNLALRHASAVIATSRNYIESSPTLKRIRDKCVVIPLAIRLEQFSCIDQVKVDLIRSLSTLPLILAVGRLVDYKGFIFLIRAMQYVNAHLILIGNGPLRNQLELEAQRLGVIERVTFVQDVQDLLPYYQAADIFVLPSISRAEAFGIVQLEAMACSKPVVNTAIDSGVVFASPSGKTGLTVPPLDPDALANALNKLLGDSELRTNLGSEGRQRVEREFTAEVMAHKTLDLYKHILKPSSGD